MPSPGRRTAACLAVACLIAAVLPGAAGAATVLPPLAPEELLSVAVVGGDGPVATFLSAGGSTVERGAIDVDLVMKMIAERAKVAGVRFVGGVFERLTGETRVRYLEDLLDAAATLLTSRGDMGGHHAQRLVFVLARVVLAEALVATRFPASAKHPDDVELDVSLLEATLEARLAPVLREGGGAACDPAAAFCGWTPSPHDQRRRCAPRRTK